MIKIKVQRIILLVGILLLAGKFLAYYLTDSVGILTDAMESIVNVAAGFMGLYSVWVSAKPKDEDHPFGHGKIEMLTASIEGVMIMAAGFIIVWEGGKRIINPVMPESLDVGIWIVAGAGLVNWLLGAWSIRVGKKHSSIALISGGKHLQSDTYSSVGLVLGLILLYVTKIAWIDGALALIFGSIIIVTGIGILRKTIQGLMDRTDEVDLARVVEMVNQHRRPTWIDIHELRVISYGEVLHVDCHLTIPWYYNVRQGHTECDELERFIVEGLKPNDGMVSVHSDPCDERLCSHCQVQNCEHRMKAFENLSSFTRGSLIINDADRGKRLGARWADDN